MSKFRTKPVEVEAIQLTYPLISECLFDGATLPAGVTFRGEAWPSERRFVGNFVCQSRQGEVSVSVDDWIIQELDAPGLSYPCKPDVFEAKYEAVDG